MRNCRVASFRKERNPRENDSREGRPVGESCSDKVPAYTQLRKYPALPSIFDVVIPAALLKEYLFSMSREQSACSAWGGTKKGRQGPIIERCSPKDAREGARVSPGLLRLSHVVALGPVFVVGQGGVALSGPQEERGKMRAFLTRVHVCRVMMVSREVSGLLKRGVPYVVFPRLLL